MDRGVVLESVRQGGGALQFAAGDLPADRGAVLMAVAQHGVLDLASEALRADRGVAQGLRAGPAIFGTELRRSSKRTGRWCLRRFGRPGRCLSTLWRGFEGYST